VKHGNWILAVQGKGLSVWLLLYSRLVPFLTKPATGRDRVGKVTKPIKQRKDRTMKTTYKLIINAAAFVVASGSFRIVRAPPQPYHQYDDRACRRVR
jgi:hypothetical protein